MLARIRSAALVGLDCLPVALEVTITNGLPAFHIVGLPDAAVRESRERVVSALRTAGFSFPLRRITANLAPAHVRKEGSAFDLPLALAVLAASGQVPGELASEWLVVGELALDGALRPVRGALAYAEGALRAGVTTLVLPRANAAEAALVAGLDVRGVESLGEVVDWLRGGDAPARALAAEIRCTATTAADDDPWAEIAGQSLAKRALEIAAAGGHNVLLVGPPGVGKTLIARSLPALLPPLDDDEALEVLRIHSVAGLLGAEAQLARTRPFRAPHASISTSGLIGGGSPPRAGEITLAHRGVLFLDELPEFRRDALEALRIPLEDGEIRVVRRAGTARFPAEFQFVAAMNPCPCGFLGHPKRACRCTPKEVQRYAARVSGPLLDRIDLLVEVPIVTSDELWTESSRESSTAVRERGAAARARQRARGSLNAQLWIPALREHCALDWAGNRLIADAVDRCGISARAVHRVVRVARTIADLAGEETIRGPHVAEALQYRTSEAAT